MPGVLPATQMAKMGHVGVEPAQARSGEQEDSWPSHREREGGPQLSTQAAEGEGQEA